MSMHKIPLTSIERIGLENHGLDIDKPSQLSDVFRQGVAHGLLHATTRITELEAQLADAIDDAHREARELDRVNVKLADAKKDTARLGWLNTQVVSAHSGDGYYQSSIDFKWGDSIIRRHLRQAVDAAMHPKEQL